MELIAMGILAC